MCIFRIQAPDRHGSESEKEGMWPKIGEIGAVGGLLPCLPFGPGPGLGLVAALPAIWSDLTTDAGDKRIHHRPTSVHPLQKRESRSALTRKVYESFFIESPLWTIVDDAFQRRLGEFVEACML